MLWLDKYSNINSNELLTFTIRIYDQMEVARGTWGSCSSIPMHVSSDSAWRRTGWDRFLEKTNWRCINADGGFVGFESDGSLILTPLCNVPIVSWCMHGERKFIVKRLAIQTNLHFELSSWQSRIDNFGAKHLNVSRTEAWQMDCVGLTYAPTEIHTRTPQSVPENKIYSNFR